MAVVAALAVAAGISRATGLEEGFAKAREATAARTAQSCWARGEDRAADSVGLPTLVCFNGSAGFGKEPRQAFAHSWDEGSCGESVSGALEISAPDGAGGNLKVEAVIESTPDSCHSRPKTRVVAYAKR